MDGKYVGNRPIKLSKVKDEVYGSIDTVTVSGKKVRRTPSGVFWTRRVTFANA